MATPSYSDSMRRRLHGDIEFSLPFHRIVSGARRWTERRFARSRPSADRVADIREYFGVGRRRLPERSALYVRLTSLSEAVDDARSCDPPPLGRLVNSPRVPFIIFISGPFSRRVRDVPVGMCAPHRVYYECVKAVTATCVDLPRVLAGRSPPRNNAAGSEPSGR